MNSKKSLDWIQKIDTLDFSEKSILQNNLDVPTAFFWKDLLREEGKTIGRLDSRYLGIDRKDAGMRPDYSAELTS